MPDRWSRRKSAAIKPIDAVGKRGGETGLGVNGLCFVGQVMGRKELKGDEHYLDIGFVAGTPVSSRPVRTNLNGFIHCVFPSSLLVDTTS
jgi:hypothetical protein